MTPQNKGKDKWKMISKASNEKCNQPRANRGKDEG